MKLEKLNKNNIDEFIEKMEISDDEFISELKKNVDKKELFTVVEDDMYYIGFESKMDTDTIAIMYFNKKLTDERFYECIMYLNNILVVDSHLIILVFDDKYMDLLNEKYKCKEIFVTYGKKSDDIDSNLKENYAELGMNSIKYYGSKNMVTCNLVRQNIQDEKMILDLHNYFVDKNKNIINFIIFSDSFEYLKSLDYVCVSKSFVINSVF